MERELLFAKNGEVLAINVTATMGKCKIFISEHGHPTLWYQADEDGGYYSSKEIVKRIPNSEKNEICHAITPIKRHYNKETKNNAIGDFYHRVKAIVRRLYKGDYVLFK